MSCLICGLWSEHRRIETKNNVCRVNKLEIMANKKSTVNKDQMKRETADKQTKVASARP